VLTQPIHGAITDAVVAAMVSATTDALTIRCYNAHCSTEHFTTIN